MGGTVEVVASELLGKTKEHFIGILRAIGPEHSFVSSDSGLTGFLNHSDALVSSIRVLRAAGSARRNWTCCSGAIRRCW